RKKSHTCGIGSPTTTPRCGRSGGSDGCRLRRAMNPREPLLHWETLRAIIGGTSALDLPRLRVENDDEAHEFLCCYGYDWNIPGQRGPGEAIRAGGLRLLEEWVL